MSPVVKSDEEQAIGPEAVSSRKSKRWWLLFVFGIVAFAGFVAVISPLRLDASQRVSLQRREEHHSPATPVLKVVQEGGDERSTIQSTTSPLVPVQPRSLSNIYPRREKIKEDQKEASTNHPIVEKPYTPPFPPLKQYSECNGRPPEQCLVEDGCVAREQEGKSTPEQQGFSCYSPGFSLKNFKHKPSMKEGWDPQTEFDSLYNNNNNCQEATSGPYKERYLNEPRSLPSGGGDDPDSAGEELKCSWSPVAPSPLPKRISLEPYEPSPRGSEEKEEVLIHTKNISLQKQMIRNFKYFTGSFFQRWYEWSAPVVQLSTKGNRRKKATTTPDSSSSRRKELEEDAEEFQLRGGHQGTDKAYVLENFCVRPGGGKLAGYKPQLGPWKGGVDLEGLFGPNDKNNRIYRESMEDWFKNVEPLSKPPAWYIDRPLAIQQIKNEVHPAHWLHRSSPLIPLIDRIFPRRAGTRSGNCPSSLSSVSPSSPVDTRDWARPDVTTMFFELRHPNHSDQKSGRMNDSEAWENLLKVGKGRKQQQQQIYRFTTMVTTSHFHTLMHQDRDRARQWLEESQLGKRFALQQQDNEIQLGREDSPQARSQKVLDQFYDFLETPICFKKAVIYQSCYAEDCNLKTSPPASRMSWPIFGSSRNPATTRKIARRFRACALVPARSHATDSRLNILIAYRTRTRNFVNFNLLVPKVIEWAHGIKNRNNKRVSSNRGEKGGEGAKVMFRQWSDGNSAWQLSALYSEVDILVSPYGTELLYSFLLPAAPAGGGGLSPSIVIQFNGPAGAKALANSGLNSNPYSDYGGMLKSIGAQHILQLLNDTSSANGGQSLQDWYLLTLVSTSTTSRRGKVS